MAYLGQTNSLSVAILLEDLLEAQKISRVFRKTGIIPHVYQSLEDFWKGTLESLPSISVVDVSLMNSNDFLLKDHPFVQDGSMATCFYCSLDTKHLLANTYDIFNYGNIAQEDSYSGQIKGILWRLNKMNEHQKNYKKEQTEFSNLDNKVVKLVENIEWLKEDNFYKTYLKSVIGRFEIQKTATDFWSACENVIVSVKEIKKFTLLELSLNGQKLISPKSLEEKFVEIPSLWLGKTCESGIEFFAQNMSSQVCLDLLGGNLMSLLIQGKNENPDKILFVSLDDDEFSNKFDWESLERYLSGLNCYFDLKDGASTNYSAKNLRPWELFTKIDQINFGKLPGAQAVERSNDYNLINIDFTNLIDLAREKRNIRFYWNNFFNDFFTKFEEQKKVDFQLTPMGIYDMSLLVKGSDADKIFIEMKSYIKRYPFWRYFEDADIVLSKDMKPKIKMIPLSIEGYMNFLEDVVEAREEKRWEETGKMITSVNLRREIPPTV